MPVRIVRIGDTEVGEGLPCYVVAEAGVNHNGDLAMARQLTAKAKEAGANAVKFQTFRTECLVTRNTPKADYQKETTGSEGSQWNMLKSLELPYEAHLELKDCAASHGIAFLSTPYDDPSVELLTSIGVPGFKVSSADITNHPLLASMAATGVPIVLSTGMSTLGEIEDAIEVLVKAGNTQIVLLQCSFNYPAKLEDVNLRAMHTLRQAFGFPVGYSDHTVGIEVSLAAVALGAVMIEKHFTLDRNLPGPDHRASAEPAEFAALVAGIRNVERALGSPVKKPSSSEARNREVCRRSIVAASDIPEGSIITAAMLAFKRPGFGLPPKDVGYFIGRRAALSIEKDRPLSWDCVR